MDNKLWTHVENLLHICNKDMIAVKVRDFKIYNGITEVNGKYLLATAYLDLNGQTYIFSDTENIDSIYKSSDSDSLFMWLKNGILLRLEGDFACQE